VQFKNGDHLSGKWLKVEGTTIKFRSKVLGKIAIPVAKVSTFSIEQPLVVMLQNGKTISGDGAQLAAGTWTVQSPQGNKQVPSGNVTMILPAAAYHAAIAEAKEKTEPWRGWKGGATFGYSLQNGDQNARTVSLGIAAVRHEPRMPGALERWRTNVNFNLLFANASSDGVTVSSNSLTSSLRQDYFFQPQNFLFMLGQWDHILSQNLDLRQVYGGGYGRQLLSGPRVQFSLLAGATFANEKFSGTPAQQYAEALVGEHATFQFTKKVRINHSFTFYPNLSNRGQYRFDTASAIAFSLNSWLSANMGLTDYYISQIPSGSVSTVTTIGSGGQLTTVSFPSHNNNITVTAGLGVNF
jgi:putative salt-induced outer membrane protein YdiY